MPISPDRTVELFDAIVWFAHSLSRARGSAPDRVKGIATRVCLCDIIGPIREH